MAKSGIMNAKDTVSGALAQCTVKIPYDLKTNKRLTDGSTCTYVLMQATKVEAKFDKNKVEVPILGKTGKGNKSVGWKGTGTATFHYNTTLFRRLLKLYADTGEDIYFDMTIINEDKSTAVGKQTIVLVDCNLDGGIIAKFDAGTEVLDEDASFTFEDFRIGKDFTALEAFQFN